MLDYAQRSAENRRGNASCWARAYTPGSLRVTGVPRVGGSPGVNHGGPSSATATTSLSGWSIRSNKAVVQIESPAVHRRRDWWQQPYRDNVPRHEGGVPTGVAQALSRIVAALVRSVSIARRPRDVRAWDMAYRAGKTFPAGHSVLPRPLNIRGGTRRSFRVWLCDGALCQCHYSDCQPWLSCWPSLRSWGVGPAPAGPLNPIGLGMTEESAGMFGHCRFSQLGRILRTWANAAGHSAPDPRGPLLSEALQQLACALTPIQQYPRFGAATNILSPPVKRPTRSVACVTRFAGFVLRH